MKKHLLFALGIACAATCFTACHDDDDEDGEKEGSYVFDPSSVVIDESIIGKASAATGVSTYTLTSNMISVYCYNLGDKQTIIESYMNEDGSLTDEGLSYLGENMYGGFTPTWFTADTEEENAWYLVPACGSFKSSAALLCNPGEFCKALFHKEIALSASGLLSATLVKDPVCLYACPTILYNELENGNENNYIDDYVALPAGDEIRLVVYGYVDSFNVSSWDKTLNTFKSAFSSATGGGTKSENYITLAKANSEGKVTVNKDWQKLSLADINDFYCFECYIEVVKSDGKKDTNYELCDDLKYCLVSDISFDGRFKL